MNVKHYRIIVVTLLALTIIGVFALLFNVVEINEKQVGSTDTTVSSEIETTKKPVDSTTIEAETTAIVVEETTSPEITSTDVLETTATPEITYTPNEDSSDIIHIIKNGDTFWDMSRTYYGSAQYATAMARYNGLELTSVVHVGDEFRIPKLDNEIFNKIYEEIKSQKPDVTYMSGETIKAGDNDSYRYGVRSNPAVDITVPTGTDMKNYTDKVDTSEYIYIGKWMVTGYTPTCEHCCHSTEGITASGVRAICGYTIATPLSTSIPFQVTIYIPEYGYYVSEDRVDTTERVMDIATPTHEACGPLTDYNIGCYIVPNPGDKIITEANGIKKLVDSNGKIKLVVNAYGEVIA